MDPEDVQTIRHGKVSQALRVGIPDFADYEPPPHIHPGVEQVVPRLPAMGPLPAVVVAQAIVHGPKRARPSSRQRNSYCTCGSGRKGKNCCFGDTVST